MHAKPQIGPYSNLPAVCHDYDPRAAEVAARVAELVQSRNAEVTVEHIGSTAVPGCSGKGIVDLMVLYPAHRLESVKVLLAELGFQPQTSRDPFPEDRPMRTGSLRYESGLFTIHAHVLAADSPETHELRQFRDQLKNDPRLLASYVALKRRIIGSGVTDAVDYALAKTDFVRTALSGSNAPTR